ncbi:MAG TPA: IPT/TIG domain-containing protein [Vicinamibacterales bacterium]|nr:IPT/TIG domain-containing protein [Vicinamibacterales bacterium]
MPARVTAVRPTRAVESGRIVLEGTGFPVDGPRLPEVQIGGASARVVQASSSALSVIVPSGLDGGPTPIRVEGARGETPFVDVAAPLATGLHQVDNPVFDREGNLYVTYSGTRGQQVPVSIFKVRPNGTRETFSSGIVNATSMAMDAHGRLYVSSRFEGTVYRVAPDGSFEPFATDLGIACGLAFSKTGELFVGDRSGTIFRVDESGKATAFATLPSSVAAFHLAIAPDGYIWLTAPTLSTYDPIYKVAPDGVVSTVDVKFGRPQGIAFNPGGEPYVVEALAGASGVYRIASDNSLELVVAGPNLIGLAFDLFGNMVVCSGETAYRLK